ncbi:hypothetical protein [Sedimenticola sp.]|uniref:hypothetical protein n=1 Tax=Sedimenticola sp. TaxID=1940285 RepID=UPI003D1408F2
MNKTAARRNLRIERHVKERPFAGYELATLFSLEGVNPLLMMSMASVASSPGAGMQPPGRCSKARYGKLRREVIRHCKGKKSKCTKQQDCDELNENQTRNTNCANARRQLNRACFRGGDAGHRTAAAKARVAANKCKRIAKEKDCP